MSVYIRSGSPDGVYSYDFQQGGERFSGSTGKTRKRDAEAEEQRIRDDVKRRQAERKAAIVKAGPDLTIKDACMKWWAEKAADYVESVHGDMQRYLAWLTDHFGHDTPLHEIGDAEVAKMVAARRGEPNQNFKSRERLISKTTVNRSSTAILNRVMLRARKVWKIPLQEIDWRQHTLAEPKEIVREASTGEEQALLEHLGRGYQDAVRFAMRLGARRMELLKLDWTDVDFFSNRVTLKGKRGRSRLVPLPSDMRELLWSLKDHHPVKVFTYVAEHTQKLRNGVTIVRGQRYPISEEGLRRVFEQARRKAGVANFRFHDTRHTAATRLLRSSGNLRLVSKLLGHAQIATTVKYAHATIDDLAEAMAAMVPQESHGVRGVAESPTGSPTDPRPKVAND